ncbi:CBS domain-containing protein [Thiothrix subterranea]|uniref:CBS domain-containing protein n=1 Tax=Thiothrix subterranea TaxID=2735563 RepID=A0AA51MQA8_9GAMM|nr:CBS domain-containing protein [Thiothrix subterranea]MDQ5767028.1 CBS domain-containing protein [Thiothrix subterranea]WML88110.1 CBS domain-containing protein [Thiothrix subterranea]
MKTVSDILAKKGTEILSISPTVTVIDAVKAMAQQKVGALLVLEAGKLKGIVSEQDYTRKVILTCLNAEHMLVQDIMTRQVVVTRPDQPVQEVMAIMTERRIRHLPVMHNGELVGLVSIGDLVKEIISEQQFIIAQLENYIHG